MDRSAPDPDLSTTLQTAWPDARWSTGWGAVGVVVRAEQGDRWLELEGMTVRVGVGASAEHAPTGVLAPASVPLPGRVLTGDVAFDAAVVVCDRAWLPFLGEAERHDVRTLVEGGWWLGWGEARCLAAKGEGLPHAVERVLALLVRWAEAADHVMLDAWQHDPSVIVQQAARAALTSRLEGLDPAAVAEVIRHAVEGGEAALVLDRVPLHADGVAAWCEVRGPFDDLLLRRLRREGDDAAWGTWAVRAWRASPPKVDEVLGGHVATRWGREPALRAMLDGPLEGMPEAFARWVGSIRAVSKAAQELQAQLIVRLPWRASTEVAVRDLESGTLARTLGAHWQATGAVPRWSPDTRLAPDVSRALDWARSNQGALPWLLAAAPAVAPWLQLADAAPSNQRRQLEVLEAEGEPCDAALASLLQATDPEVQVDAARLLGVLGGSVGRAALAVTAQRWSASARLRTASREAIAAIDARSGRGGVAVADDGGALGVPEEEA